MNAKTKTGMEILQAALLLGLLGDALLRATPWGLNVLLWVGALVTALVMLGLRHRRELLNRETWALHTALVVFAGFIAWRDSGVLKALDVLVILLLLAILSLPALKIQIQSTGFLQYAFGAIVSGLNAAFAPFQLLFADVEWKQLPQSGWTKHLSAVLRGLAIAAPLVLIFGGLFMAADAIFENIVNNTLRIDSGTFITHILLFGFLAWTTAGYLRGALLGNWLNNAGSPADTNGSTLNLRETGASVVHNSAEDKFVDQTPHESLYRDENQSASLVPKFLQLGTIEIAIVLGALNLLFLSFVSVQFRYFFGGMNLVQVTDDLKLAEYARRGFFELCWVAALVLPILLATHFLLEKESHAAAKLYRILATIKIGLLFIIMYSAVERMLLYTGPLGYGLTEMRLYPTSFILWLALVFAWFALTVLRNQPKFFAWGALWMGLFVVASLHVLNPDNFIVRHNVRLMQQGRMFDAGYNSQLSADALPALIDAMPSAPFIEQCHLKNRFLQQIEITEPEDLRTFNYSRWKARQILFNTHQNLDVTNCPNWTGPSYNIFDDRYERHAE